MLDVKKEQEEVDELEKQIQDGISGLGLLEVYVAPLTGSKGVLQVGEPGGNTLIYSCSR